MYRMIWKRANCACLRKVRIRRKIRKRLYPVLALWCQYLSLAALAVYALLRLLLTPDLPLGHYSGPLELLWPASYVLLLVSSVADHVSWRSDVAEAEEEDTEQMPDQCSAAGQTRQERETQGSSAAARPAV